MKHINLLTCTEIREIPEWDKSKFSESEYDIQYNSKDDIVWDAVVIRQNVPYPYSFKCKKGGVIYTNCEPPQAWPLPQDFINQFDFIMVQNPKVKHSNKLEYHGFESWTIGRSYTTKKNRFFYEELKILEPFKSKNISIITSNTQQLPGHIKRLEVINKLKKDFPNEIDFFGRGFRYVDVKGDALLPYRFHICIENAFIPHCWTEKFADPVLSQTVPVYAGCTNLDDYFGDKGYIKFDIDDYDSLKKIINQILRDPEGEYLKYKSSLQQLRQTLMEKENIIPYVCNFVNSNTSLGIQEYSLRPMEQCKWFKWQFYMLRLRSKLYKFFYVNLKKLIK